MKSYFLTKSVSLFWNLVTGDFYLAEESDDFWILDLPKGKSLLFEGDQTNLGDYSISLYSNLNYLVQDNSDLLKQAELLYEVRYGNC